MVVAGSGGMYSYYTKVVRTTYTYLDGRVVDTNQFSVTEHFTTVEQKQGLFLLASEGS